MPGLRSYVYQIIKKKKTGSAMDVGVRNVILILSATCNAIQFFNSHLVPLFVDYTQQMMRRH